MVLTPDPEDSQEDLRKFTKDSGILSSQKNLQLLLGTKYPEFNYTDWLIEFKNAVSCFANCTNH